MSIALVVTRGYGNGTFDGDIANIVTRGYAIGEAVAVEDVIGGGIPAIVSDKIVDPNDKLEAFIEDQRRQHFERQKAAETEAAREAARAERAREKARMAPVFKPKIVDAPIDPTEPAPKLRPAVSKVKPIKPELPKIKAVEKLEAIEMIELPIEPATIGDSADDEAALLLILAEI